ncbi:rhodanese-related sulfurtransferase [Smaragdicoccus niigatensis]
MKWQVTLAQPKILLFYVFTPLADPEAIRLWQKTVCEMNDVKGRIIVSPHGINVTVGGELDNVKGYLKATRAYLPFRWADVKWANGTGNDFPRLSVKARDEIVTFGTPDELKVDENGIVGGGVHLKPEQVHELVAERGDDVVFIDGRNAYEAEIGRFKNAIIPPIETTRDFLEVIDSGVYDHLKTRPIVTYCTGGVRCEVLSALMKNRGFEEVYQIEGGIVRYGEKFGDKGLWEGSLYVFDGRISTTFSPDAKIISKCALCGEPTDRYENYPDENGRELKLVCLECSPTA